MYTPLLSDPLYSSFSQIHRAVVQYSSTTTGDIEVIIPSVTGLGTTVPISFFGREAHPIENDWVVPNVGSTIVVCREDEDYTNVFWINTTYNPVRADVGEANPTEYGFGPSGLGFPLMAITPTSSGLYLSNTHMGYYFADPPSGTNAAWRTFMSYNGNFYLTGSGSATHGLTWTANTNTLAISGNITIRNPADVRTTLEVGLNAEANPDSYLFGVNHDLLDITDHPDGGEDVLVLSATHLGHHNGNGLISGWKTYMSKSGDFYLAGDGSHGLTWDGSVLALDGNITIRNLTAVRSDLEVTAGAEPNTSAQDNPSTYTFGAGMDMSLVNLPATPTTAGLFLGANYLGYHSGSGGAWATYMDATGKFYLGGTSGQLQWNGSTLLIHGSAAISGTVTVGGTAASTVVSGAAAGATAVQDEDTGLDLTLTDGAVGGWVITTGVLTGGTGSYKIELDQANRRISAGGGRAVMRVDSDARVVIGIDADAGNAPTYSNSGGDVVMERTAGGTARFSCGNKLTWNGSALAITGAITSSTITGGSLTASTIQTGASGARLVLSPLGDGAQADYGTAQGGSTTTITLKSGSSAYNDYYNGWMVTITSGTGVGQTAKITDYNGSNKVANAIFATAPTSSSAYRLEYNTYTFLQGYAGGAEEVYPGFLFFYHDLEDWTNASSTKWGKVALSAPRYSNTFGYAGLNFGSDTAGRGMLSFGLPSNGDQFVIADEGSGSTPTNTFNRGGITIASGAPASTNNTLYADGTTLKWHGSAIGGSSGVDSIIAGSNITLSPSNGLGDVTVTATATNTTYTAGDFDHGGLTGLGGNDHPQYLLLYGGELTGTLNLGGNSPEGWPTIQGGNIIINPTGNSYLRGGNQANFGVTAWASGETRLHYQTTQNFSCLDGRNVSYKDFRPSAHLNKDLGHDSYNWNYLYADKIDLPVYTVGTQYLLYQEDATDEFRRSSSTQRIKDNIASLVDSESLERIKGLRPVTFTAKYQGSTTYTNTLWPFKTHYGFIAEEVGVVDKNYAVWDWWVSDDPEDEGYIKSKPTLAKAKKVAAGDAARQSSLDEGGTDEEAQEAYDVAYAAEPEWTEEELEDHWDIDEAQATALDNIAILADAVGAIKELSTKLDAAEARIAVLEST